MQTFRAALFIISTNWKQPSHLTDKRRSKLRSLQMMTQPSGSRTRLLVLGQQGGLKCTVQKGRGQTHRLHSVVVHACSVVSDFCDLMDCSWPGFSVHGIFHGLDWVAISFSRGSSQPRDQTHVSYISCISRQEATREAPAFCMISPIWHPRDGKTIGSDYSLRVLGVGWGWGERIELRRAIGDVGVMQMSCS